MNTPSYTCYEPRPLTHLGIEEVAGYRLKAYAIHRRDAVFDRERFAGVWKLAAAALPAPATSATRPAVGFAILHQGRTVDYFVLGWWDNENELPTLVFVRDQQGWRSASAGESFCVWDLRVIWWEREAYVGTVLAGRPNGLSEYLTARIDGFC